LKRGFHCCGQTRGERGESQRKKKINFESGAKGPVSLGKMRGKFLRGEPLAKSKIEFLSGENRFLAEFLADP